MVLYFQHGTPEFLRSKGTFAVSSSTQTKKQPTSRDCVPSYDAAGPSTHLTSSHRIASHPSQELPQSGNELPHWDDGRLRANHPTLSVLQNIIVFSIRLAENIHF